ncbi:MAG: NAD kinase [Candidatus Thioglobus sp.]|nr:NAD kinase [Candidatus Thioglobus sp.]
MFNVVGLITKPNDPTSEEVASKLRKFLKGLGIKVVFYQQDIIDSAEMVIVLGGDGTFVGAARNFVDAEIPLLGVNLGRLGFLTDINADKMFDTIENVLAGQYNTEERFMLTCKTSDGEEHQALNDVVFHRSTAPRMINADVYINGKFVNNGSADGIIVNTPTGSTAYALSSGGPIINTGVDAISLVYISPHAMTYRPFIFNAGDEVRIRLKEPKHGASLIIDGQVSAPIHADKDVFIKKHKKSLKLIHPQDYDFFSILRSKLHWNK